MSSLEKTITHDHIYTSYSEIPKDCNQSRDSPSNSSFSHRRLIRTKRDIQTDDDHEEYSRRRTLNNTSCRISRLHHRSKLDCIIKKCTEYENLNTKLNFQQSVMIQVIDQLKEHLRILVSNNIKQN